MTLVNPYCAVQDVRDQLADAGANADEGRIEMAINGTSRAIEVYCGRRFWTSEEPTALRYRPRDPEVVLIHDIASSDGLLVKTGDSGSFDTTWTLDVDFLLEPLNASLLGPAYSWWQLTAIGDKQFSTGLRRPSLQVTGLPGWTQIPEQVHSASVLKATSLFKRADAPFGIASFGDFGAIRITRKDVDVMELLNPFQRITPADD